MTLDKYELLLAPSKECQTITEVLRYWVARQPDKLLYRWLDDAGNEETIWTYADVDRKARAVALELRKHAQVGDRALLLYAPGLEYVAAFLGCLYAGVVAVPAYPPDPSRLEQSLPRLLSILEDCKPLLLMSTNMLFQFGEALWGTHPSFEDMLQLATDNIDEIQADNWVMPDINGETLAFLQYTSGSTASPKGVMVSHSNLVFNSYACHIGAQHTVDDIYVSWLPGYHDFGLIGGILQPLTGGYTGCLMSPISFLKKPFRWLEAISRYRAVTSPFPNFALELCMRKITEAERKTLDLSSWRIACNGAEPVRFDTMARFAELYAPCGFDAAAFIPGYGLAEATLGVSGIKANLGLRCLHVDSTALSQDEIIIRDTASEDTKSFVSCSKPIIQTKVLIVDPGNFGVQPENRVGEIWVQGPGVCQGYWNNPTLSEEVFCAKLATGEGDFLRTGDLGFFHQGELFIAGRLKDLIIVQGKNHYPQDLEKTAESAHSAIRAGCLAAFSTEIDNEERVVIVAELDPRAGETDLGELRKTVRSAIAQAHGLALHDIAIIQANTINKTSSGKIQRHASKKLWLANELDILEAAITR